MAHLKYSLVILSLVFAINIKAEKHQISDLPPKNILQLAFNGYEKLLTSGRLSKEKQILTIIDYSLSANKKRMWIIDMSDTTVILHILVSHGKNSGQEYARFFSNETKSYKTSLGFFTTGQPYYGKHGLSLYLDGVEKGINDNARKRSIVIHGASYVNTAFVKKYGRLGRSHGCPAVSDEQALKVINLLKGKTCLFSYYPSQEYLKKSRLIR